MRPNEKDLQALFLFVTLLLQHTLLIQFNLFFVELFCTPKSSMENPSLRVSHSGSNTSRTFIAENYPEDEYGLWAIDESAGEQGYVDDERSCFLVAVQKISGSSG